MLTVREIQKKAQRLWPRLLASTVSGEAFLPYSLSLAPPKSADLGAQFNDIRQWVRSLETFIQRHQLQLEYKTLNHRRIGKQRLPSRLLFSDSQKLLNLLGRNKDYQFFCENLVLIRRELPELEVWLYKNYRQLEAQAGLWPELIAIVKYFQSHPLPDNYLRALDIPGIDSKFIESHHTIIRQLLDASLPVNAIHEEYTGTGITAFCERFGLRHDQPLIRFRWLDDRLNVHTLGMKDISVPVEQLSNLNPTIKWVFITENKTNFLSFPERENSLILFGKGYAIDLLTKLPWLKEKQVYYWGDIDTHGFNILNKLRKYLRRVDSLLMDEETLLTSKQFWGKENPDKRFTYPLLNLNNEEKKLYQALVNNKYEENLRLEQERIPLIWLKKNLKGY